MPLASPPVAQVPVSAPHSLAEPMADDDEEPAWLHQVKEPALVGLMIRRDRMALIAKVLVAVLSAWFFLLGVNNAMRPSDDVFLPRYGEHRFATDNAVAATANAVEHLARRQTAANSAPWFIAALLCWILISLGRLREVREE